MKMATKDAEKTGKKALTPSERIAKLAAEATRVAGIAMNKNDRAYANQIADWAEAAPVKLDGKRPVPTGGI